MHPEFFIAIIAGLGGMLGWGFADFFAKKTIDEIGDIASLVWAHLFGTLAFALISFYLIFFNDHELVLPGSLGEWGMIISFGVLQAIVYLLAYRGFGKGQLAVLNPVFASYSGAAALLSVIIFGEVLGMSLLFSLGIIFAGILVLNLDFQALKIKKFNLTHTPGLKEILLAAGLAAFWTIFWDNFVGGKDWVVYAFLMYLFMTVAAFLFAKFQKVKLKVTKRSVWKFLILIGVCETIAYLAISLGFSATSYTSVVAILSGAFSLPTIILARAFLKEKITPIQTIGTLIIIAGIILLSINS